ncbi:hypothetical protein TSAR_006909 [Trichomalopsis sarcophagae]|uniref:Uncharacterized protein n=1 Tax=Trichomalopsis sarcophagae TaxID=543379 RepID=A0A232EFI5_9HYME|nr:hypothetical protein TSAR_006909 [Trichomalopsis sarcophagae]
MRELLSARTVSQSGASKKRGPDGRERRVSSITSGKSASSLSIFDEGHRRLRESTRSTLFVDSRSTIRGELGEFSEYAKVC